MTWLYVLCGIVLFFVIIFTIPLSLRGSFDDYLTVSARYAFLKFTLLPKKEKKKKKPKKTNASTEKLKETSKKGFLKKHGTLNAIRFFKDAVVKLFEAFFKIAMITKIKRFELYIAAAGEDAAHAAIKYGEICALLYPTLGIAVEKLRVNKSRFRVNIIADYTADNDVVKCEFVLHINLFRTLCIVISAFGKTIFALVNNTTKKTSKK